MYAPTSNLLTIALAFVVSADPNGVNDCASNTRASSIAKSNSLKYSLTSAFTSDSS